MVGTQLSGSSVILADTFSESSITIRLNGMALIAALSLVNVSHSAWQGIGQYGDNSWAAPDTFGTDQPSISRTIVRLRLRCVDTDASDAFKMWEAVVPVCRFQHVQQHSRRWRFNHGTETTGRPVVGGS